MARETTREPGRAGSRCRWWIREVLSGMAISSAASIDGVGRRPRRARLRQRVPVSEIAIRRPAAETAMAVAYALAYVGLSFLVPLAISRFPMPLWGASEFLQDVSYAIVFKIVFLLVVPVVAYIRLGYGTEDLLLGWRPRPAAVLAVIVAFAAGAAININRAPAIGAALDSLPIPEALGRSAVGTLLALLMAGLPEEIFFRGILQTRLEKTLGRAAAIVITALLFTAWHIPPRLALAQGVEGHAGDLVSVLIGTGAPVLVVALVLGVSWDRWRNLPVLVALHWGIDLLPIVSSMLRIPPR
jgi:membrane protease YdiL (CAAX protease family)